MSLRFARPIIVSLVNIQLHQKSVHQRTASFSVTHPKAARTLNLSSGIPWEVNPNPLECKLACYLTSNTQRHFPQLLHPI